MTENKMDKQYQTTKEQCLSRIKGVCEGCGGNLEPIETVDNAGSLTFWIGCKKCSCFRCGVDKAYFNIARELVLDGTLIPYRHIIRSDNEEYWLSSQTSNASFIVKRIAEELNNFKEKLDG